MREFLDLAKRFRQTPIISDDFPEMTHRFDSELMHLAATMPKIVCLCGSTKFKEYFIAANFAETMRGNIVLSVGFFRHTDEEFTCTDEEKMALDELHKRKIDLADEVLVLNVDGYVGESTRSEIEYAIVRRKPVRYLECIS